MEKKQPCACGSCFTALEKIEGREDDVFKFMDSEGKDVSVFPDFIRRCILFAGNITDYRVVQDTDNAITVFADISDEMKKKVYQEFGKLSEDKNFILPEIKFDNYYYDKRRKLKRVERLADRRN